MENSGQITIDLRSASEVSQILAKHGVQSVVLNACRSAKGHGFDKNVAITLINHGITEVVAMGYKVGSSAVEKLTKSFYEALLVQRRSFADATRAGDMSFDQNLRRRLSSELKWMCWTMLCRYVFSEKE